MRCPLCQAPITRDDARCPGCDALLERLPFLSMNLDEAPAEVDDEADGTGSSKVELGGDTLIVGPLDDDFSSLSGSGESALGLTPDEYLEARTGLVERSIAPAPVYLSGAIAETLKKEAVLALVPGEMTLSPFEQHVASFLDGQRPLARVARMANLSLDDARIALAMLLERKHVILIGHVVVPPEHGGQEVAPPRAPMQPAPPPLPRAPTPPPKAAPPPKPAPPKPAPPKPSPPGKRYGEQQDVRLLKSAIEKEKEGDYEGAVNLLHLALDVNPRAGVLHNRLGVVLATRLKEYEAACDALIRACELEPHNDTYKANLMKIMERAEAERGQGKQAARKGFFRKR